MRFAAKKKETTEGKYVENRAHHIIYYGTYAVMLACMIGALIAIPKPVLHMGLNACHTPWADVFWRVVSMFAEWLVYVLMLWPLIGIWRKSTREKRRCGWMVASYAMAETMAALVVRIMKLWFNMPRPITFFSQLAAYGYPEYADYDIHAILVDGVAMREWMSFPSGHTSTFFVFFTMSFLLMSEKKTSIDLKSAVFTLSCLICALAGGYSRIYLSQHFLLDVCVGSVIGIVSATIIYVVLRNKLQIISK